MFEKILNISVLNYFKLICFSWVTRKNCVVCKGKGKIELLDSSCPFCNGTGEFTKFQKVISGLIYVNVFSLTEKFVR